MKERKIYSINRVADGYQFSAKGEETPVFDNIIDGVSSLMLISNSNSLEKENYLELANKLLELPYDAEHPIKFYNKEADHFNSVAEAVQSMEQQFPIIKNNVFMVYLMNHPKALPEIVVCPGCFSHGTILDTNDEGEVNHVLSMETKQAGLGQIENMLTLGKLTKEKALEYRNILENSNFEKEIKKMRKMQTIQIIDISISAIDDDEITFTGPMGEA